MTRIILSGCNGKMGKFITDIVDSRDDCEIVAGVDKDAVMLSSYPVFSAFSDIKCEADVIIDFSHPSVLSSL
ncbi:MAG: 4-hydroxy-tetrahydrodipicolinate reductase, partial [Clostridia bacterium]|nr:4-hydroxy-tetrahydrodipicolinate reductase [Clostridia bacterium]